MSVLLFPFLSAARADPGCPEVPYPPGLDVGAARVEAMLEVDANGHVAADDDRTPARLDDDHLMPVGMPGRRQQADPR